MLNSGKYFFNLSFIEFESKKLKYFRLGNEKYKSKVIWRSLDPCWLEQFDLHLYDDQEQLLELTIWDRDKQSKDDFLGR